MEEITRFYSSLYTKSSAISNSKIMTTHPEAEFGGKLPTTLTGKSGKFPAISRNGFPLAQCQIPPPPLLPAQGVLSHLQNLHSLRIPSVEYSISFLPLSAFLVWRRLCTVYAKHVTPSHKNAPPLPFLKNPFARVQCK